VDRADDSHSKDDKDNPLAEEEIVTMTEMEAVTVMASATNKKTIIMEDNNAGTAAVTGAMRIPSEPKQTGTTPEVDQHHHRWDVIHLRKQQWRWERPFYSC
jgi:threonine dehydratase